MLFRCLVRGWRMDFLGISVWDFSLRGNPWRDLAAPLFTSGRKKPNTRQISRLTLEPNILAVNDSRAIHRCQFEGGANFRFRFLVREEKKSRFVPENVTHFISHSQYHNFYYQWDFFDLLFLCVRPNEAPRRNTKRRFWLYTHRVYASRRKINRSHIFLSPYDWRQRKLM